VPQGAEHALGARIGHPWLDSEMAVRLHRVFSPIPSLHAQH
jgi:hypothetical protein